METNPVENLSNFILSTLIIGTAPYRIPQLKPGIKISHIKKNNTTQQQ